MSTTSHENAVADVERFWRAANYVTVGMMHLRANPMLLRPLSFADLKPRVVGHWGCAPGINFVWANLLAAITSTQVDARLFVGTGHAGAAWLACTVLEGSFPATCDVDAEEGLAELFAAFGRANGLPTELSAQLPGVLWTSGEIGHTLAIGQGHALAAPDARVVVVLGDGELETAPTQAALHGADALGMAVPITIVVNHNGLRMGGASQISRWSDDRLRDSFASIDDNCTIVDGFDSSTLLPALSSAVGSGGRRVIVLRTVKGAGAPDIGGSPVAGTPLAHKTPLRKISSTEDLMWLESWLRSYRPSEFFRDGRLDRTGFAALLPDSRRLPGNVARRLGTATTPGLRDVSGLADSPTEAFSSTVRTASSHGFILVTSPDELSSNRLQSIAGDRVHVVEHLSEHLCAAWVIGWSLAGRIGWFTSYDAFAPLTSSLMTQYLKSLAVPAPSDDLTDRAAVGVFLTSLGWRNSYSHQEPSFVSGLLEKEFPGFRCYLPITAPAMAAAVRAASQGRALVSCIVADKNLRYRGSPLSRLPLGVPYSVIQRGTGLGKLRERTVVVVVGDYLVAEAVRGVKAVIARCPDQSVDVAVLEELTWLYREDDTSRHWRSEFADLVTTANDVLLVTSLYGSVLGELLRRVLPATMPLTVRGFRPSPTAVSGVGMLLGSGCSWPQLARAIIEAPGGGEERVVRHQKARTRLEVIERRLMREVAEAYEDPAGYWEGETNGSGSSGIRER